VVNTRANTNTPLHHLHSWGILAACMCCSTPQQHAGGCCSILLRWRVRTCTQHTNRPFLPVHAQAIGDERRL